MKTETYILLTVSFKKEKNKWTASCLELGTSTFATTLEEVKKDIKEAITLHLNTLEDVGERERFFKENKIKIFTSKPPKSVRVDVPINSNIYIQPYIKSYKPQQIQTA